MEIMDKKPRIMRVKSVKKLAETKYGLNNVRVCYHGRHGWWIVSDKAEGLISMNSIGIEKGLRFLIDNYEIQKKNELKKNEEKVKYYQHLGLLPTESETIELQKETKKLTDCIGKVFDIILNTKK